MNRFECWWVRRRAARLRRWAMVQQQLAHTHRATATRLAHEAYELDMMAEPLRWAQLYHQSKVLAFYAARHCELAGELFKKADALEALLSG